MARTINRETWLERITYEHVIPHFTESGFEMLEIMKETQKLKFSVSFIEGTRTSKAIGAHYSHHHSKGGEQHVLIHPKLECPIRVVGVLIHELIHAQLPVDAGHGKEFRRIALGVGLTGKMTATTETEELKEKIKGWVKEIGPYPHAEFDVSKTRKKQGTRMLKVMCFSGMDVCDQEFKVRMSRSLIEKMGCPYCPVCGTQMDVA